MTASKAAQAEVADRRTKLVQLRREGIPFEDQRILDLGYSSRNHASKDLVRTLKERQKDQEAAVSVYRQEENERLDALLAVVWPVATQLSPRYDSDGEELAPALDLKAVDTVLKLMDRRAKLNGYDAPVKAEVTGAGGGPLALGAAGQAELHWLVGLAGDPDDNDDLDPAEDDTAEDQGDDGDSARN